MKVALFGGTFDPIHCGHLEIAAAAADACHLDRVFFVVSSRPPHKSDRRQADFEQRYRMVEIACAADPRFEASRLEAPEMAGSEKTYSVKTIERVRRELGPADRLYFLMGEDAFGDLGIWYRLHDVLQLVEFIVATRPGGGRQRAPAEPELRAHWVETTANPASATEIRRRVAAGQPLAELVPPAVAEYIETEALYR